MHGVFVHGLLHAGMSCMCEKPEPEWPTSAQFHQASTTYQRSVASLSYAHSRNEGS